jgi:hypothetical protein
MKNKILLGTGLATLLVGIAGVFVSDKVKKNNKLIKIASWIVLSIGMILTAKVIDDELYPDALEEENPEQEDDIEDFDVEELD